MLRARLLLPPRCRLLLVFAVCYSAGALLMSSGCQDTLTTNRLLLNDPPTPRSLSRGMTSPLRLAVPTEDEKETKEGGDESNSTMIRTSYQSSEQDLSTGQALPASDPASSPLPLPLSAPVNVPNGGPLNLDTVLRLTFEHNADILAARERVNESQIALDAALSSCMPEMLRKDIFKKPVADATLWRRRVELRKIENDNMQDAANTYFDWLTTIHGEAVARDLLNDEEKLLSRARKLAQTEKPAQVVVEAIETSVTGRRQYLLQVHQQSEAAAAKLAYLMGMNCNTPMNPEFLQLIDRVDVSVPVEVLVRQAQNNGPGVQELQGLIASIQHGLYQAKHAQSLCAHTGAALVCGRLQMGQSQLRQAELSLESLQLKLRAGVEDAFTAILSGREQINLAVKTIEHAKETYRITELRLTEEGSEANMRNRTYDTVSNSIRALSQSYGNYLTVVSNYDKAQARLLLLIGTFPNCR